MDVILFNAPVTVRNEHARLSPPLGIAYLASALRNAGFTVSAVDMNVSGFNPVRVDGIIAYEHPAVVGISAMTETYPNALAIARRVKERAPETVVVIGGAHATIAPDEVMTHPEVDFVIVGAGETGIVGLVSYELRGAGMLEQVPGLVWRDGNIVRHDPRAPLVSPDELPRPARDLFPVEFYRDPWNVLTATGSCPYRCPFCSASSLWQGRRRMRSPRSVAAEVADLVREHGVSRVFFTDDLFTLDRRWVRELADELRAIGTPVAWGCATRVDQVDPDLLRTMAAAGCTGIQFGVESGSQEVLDSVKGIDKTQVLYAIRAAVDAGIEPVSSFMVPFPQDTRETLGESLEFMKAVKDAGSRIFMSYTCPYPGTSFHEHADELGLRILTDDWGRYDAKHVVMETANLSAAEIQQIAEEMAAELGLVKSVSG